MNKYWKAEIPKTISTGKNILQYYRESEKLSVARLPWTDKDGAERQGKTVALDISALTESGTDTLTAAREVFAEIVQSIDERLDVMGARA